MTPADLENLLTWLEWLITDAEDNRDQVNQDDSLWDYFDGKAEAYELIRGAVAGEYTVPARFEMASPHVTPGLPSKAWETLDPAPKRPRPSTGSDA